MECPISNRDGCADRRARSGSIPDPFRSILTQGGCSGLQMFSKCSILNAEHRTWTVFLCLRTRTVRVRPWQERIDALWMCPRGFLARKPKVSRSSIEWTEATWNPVAGCTVLSPGCTNCYAMRLASRLDAMGQQKYAATTRISGGRAKWTGKITLDVNALSLPLSWKTGRLIFVNSMSDLFHEKVPLGFIQRVFEVMKATPQHTYQVLTKRAETLEEVASSLPWPKNVWMGVSVESAGYVWRIDHLRRVPAVVRFLSLEPLLGPLDRLNLEGIQWVIAGGESGPGARSMNVEWVRSIRDQCIRHEVAFHFKQWGGTNKKRAGRLLDGHVWNEWPSVLTNVDFLSARVA
jgi:protein gp37